MNKYHSEKLAALIDHYRFEEAALQVNEQHRLLSEDPLSSFENLFSTLVEPTFRGDLQNLRGLLRMGPASPRSHMRQFIANPRMQNCLTAVLKNLEKSVPSSVHMGFQRARDFFRKSDFASTYSTDILNYEPEFSRLTDRRLAHLLSMSPNSIDLKLLSAWPVEKRREVLESYEKESLDPIKDYFKEALLKCEDFFRSLEEHSRALRDFLGEFRARKFLPDDNIISSWISLGDEYFQLELMKSSLMLPVSPKALYWGMQKDYPVTLALLAELKEAVTPTIAVGDPERTDGTWTLDIECRNPQALKSEGLKIEPSFAIGASADFSDVSVSCQIFNVRPNRNYRCLIGVPSAAPPPLRATLRISCDATCYSTPFTVEKSFDL